MKFCSQPADLHPPTAHSPATSPHLTIVNIEWGLCICASFVCLQPPPPPQRCTMTERLQPVFSLSQLALGFSIILLSPSPLAVGSDPIRGHESESQWKQERELTWQKLWRMGFIVSSGEEHHSSVWRTDSKLREPRSFYTEKERQGCFS